MTTVTAQTLQKLQ